MSSLTKKYSHWWDNSSPDFAFQPQLPQSVDIAIVGAGFTGIATAYWILRLAKNKAKNLRILIVDEGPYAAFKASGRMNGSAYLGTNKTAKQMVSLLGEKTAKQLFNYSGENNKQLRALIEQGVQCDAEFNGGFRMASTPKEVVDLDESADLLRKWGYFPARFDHNQSQHVMVVPFTKGSLFVPGEGMFDPFGFSNRLARLLRKNNVWVVYNTRVALAETSPSNGPQLILANGHVITANKIVHTTTNTVPWDRLHENVKHRREHVVSTTPLSLDLEDMPLPLMPIELNGGLDSVRIHNRSVIMTGGKAGLKNDPELDNTDDSGFNERVLQQLDRSMMHSFPITNHLEMSHAWTYIETESLDGLPFIGELPDHSGHYVNVAHGRNKFGLAFLGARSVVEKLFRLKVSSPDVSIFAPKRLTRGE